MSKPNDRIVDLFKFLKEYNVIKNPVISEIDKQVWSKWIDNIEENNYIENNIYSDDYSDELVLSVDKPERTECPKPPSILERWLSDGWSLVKEEVDVVKEKKLTTIVEDEEVTEIVKFSDDINRVKELEAWKKKRNLWYKEEYEAKRAEELFNDMYSLYATMKKESESLDLVLGDAILYCKDKKMIEHPILLQGVKVEFDPNIPRFTIVNQDRGPEIYKNIFSYIEDYNHDLVADIHKDFDEKQYCPYEKELSNQFLKRLVNALSPKGRFIENFNDIETVDKHPVIYRRPTLFLRKRNLGFGVAIDSIINDLEENDSIPDFLYDVVGIEAEEKKIANQEVINDEDSIIEANGVNEDILLTKPANLEQLSVAKHLQYKSAVLVQGPPGTGKTHTIANVIGHLLSEGKSILVTSYSEKALSVLKEKVDDQLQSLCLSLLSTVDSRKEMEITLNDINEKRSTINVSIERKKIDSLVCERKVLIAHLRELQKELKNARLNEYRSIVIGGVEYNPIDAGKYISKNKNTLEKVPTPIKLGAALTLTNSEIKELYLSNKEITAEEELEYNSNLPKVEELITPYDFKKIIQQKNSFDDNLLAFGKEYWLKESNANDIVNLKALIKEIDEILGKIDLNSDWVLETIEAGTEADIALWEGLIKEVEEVNSVYYKNNEFILKYNPEFINIEAISNIEDNFKDIIIKLESGKKIGRFTLLMNKSMKDLINACRINGSTPSKSNEFKGLLEYYKYLNLSNNLKRRWDRQVATLGAESSEKMGMQFERTTKSYCERIKINLNWYKSEWEPLLKRIAYVGINKDMLEYKNISSDRYSKLRYLKQTLVSKLKEIIEAEIHRAEYTKIKEDKIKLENIIKEKCINSTSSLALGLIKAVDEENYDRYEENYECIGEIQQLGSHIERRKELLNKLKIVASEWARLIENRVGEYGEEKPHESIIDCYIYTQLIEELEVRNKTSIDEIQNKISGVEKSLRSNTSNLAFNRAWVEMIERLGNNRSQVQAIEGWRQYIKKIGAGKGKNAEKYKNEARKLMPKCQGAVPVWIMSLNKVVENFDPKENKFDVVIIDEASQADIMAMVALYLGKQVIIVGDDQQVSPLAIGEKIDEIDRLIKEYLREIPNKDLYSGKFSVYDLAQTSGYQPVRLKEHFRCVPEIIQFSNILSYNNQIKPLRETSNVKTKPAIIPYRVEGAECYNKRNTKEAEVITSLILACCENPEYNGKTFGVITLKGEIQAKDIDKMLQSKLSAKEYEQRKILCGNSAQFQGDERDIIFTSMVDVNDSEGPMRLMSYGVDDSYKKRYNVAVSRAKDQLWVIHSLDSDNDLKHGDIRKELLDYCKNYKSRQIEFEKNVVKAESEFEKRVMKYLIEKGYNIVPQWEVGAYRIDMVVSYKGTRVALECDGERWHGEDKLVEDMSRQAILERLGWRFVRVRGSEFFSNEAASMKVVLDKLNELEIYPEDAINAEREDDLALQYKIASEALVIRESWNELEVAVD